MPQILSNNNYMVTYKDGDNSCNLISKSYIKAFFNTISLNNKIQLP
jgi:hypothetical protein